MRGCPSRGTAPSPHVLAMGRVAEALVPTYAEAWGLFPEQAESAVERHLRANGWTALQLLD